MYHIQFDLDPSNLLQGHVTILLFKVQVDGVHSTCTSLVVEGYEMGRQM